MTAPFAVAMAKDQGAVGQTDCEVDKGRVFQLIINIECSIFKSQNSSRPQ
jgi:hypothetical protein